MKTTISILIVLLFSLNLWARKTDGQFVIKKEEESLVLTPKNGFHLNKDAPASVVFDEQEALFKPTKKLEKVFEFKISQKSKKAKLAFYMCDDQKTVCEQHQEEVLLENVGAKSTEEITELKISNNEGDAGFENKVAIDKVKNNQKNKNTTLLNPSKSTIYMFSAPWCPACLRMQTETLNRADIKELLKKINFVKINSDLPDNHELSEKYAVKAIPTLILVNNKSQELYRWLDFQEANLFKADLKKVLLSHTEGKDQLLDQAKIGDQEAISQLGMLAYNSLDCESAIKWLQLSKKNKDQKYKLAAEVMCAESSEDHEPTLLKAMTLTTSQIDRLRWFIDYADKLKERNNLEADIKVKIESIESELFELQKNTKNYQQSFKDSTLGEMNGFEWAELQLMRMRNQINLGNVKKRDELALELIQKIKNKKTSTLRPGEMLLKISYLREAGEINTVEKMYKDLISKNMKSYVYYEKYSRFLLKQKRFEDALNQSDKAISFSEGNRPQLFLLKARILKEDNKNELAKQIIEDGLNLDEIKHDRYKKTLAQLKKIQAELSTNTQK